MSGVLAWGESGELTLTASVLKTGIQLAAAANHRCVVKALMATGKGTVVTDTPIRLRMVRQSTAGTMSAATLKKNNEGDNETPQTVLQINATAEPTIGDVVGIWEFHPQAGLAFFFPPGQEPVVIGGNRLGFELLAAQGQTVALSVLIEE